MPRRGFTLLEIILALAILVVVTGLIGMALDLNVRMVDAGRGDVEEAQLARSILRSIADDLRVVVQNQVCDVGGTEQTLSDVFSGATQSGQSTSGGDTGDATQDGAETDDMASETPEHDLTASVVQTEKPGLIGTSDRLLFDTSRLPRIDEYQVMLVDSAAGALSDRPSDVKSVSYYVDAIGTETAAFGADGALATTQKNGLYRRSLDRAVTQWAAQNGNTSGVDGAARVIAPEVSAILFEYYDGAEWLEEWDSVSSGELPRAIRITITIERPAKNGGVFGADQEPEPRDYSLTVSLPRGKTAEELAASGGSSGQGNSGTNQNNSGQNNSNSNDKNSNSQNNGGQNNSGQNNGGNQGSPSGGNTGGVPGGGFGTTPGGGFGGPAGGGQPGDASKSGGRR